MRIKLVCLNIWIGGKLLDAAMDFLKQEKPDILAMQEVYGGKNPGLEARLRTFEFIKQELGYPHAFFSPATLDILKEGNIEQGNAIFSKFPISRTSTIFFDVPLQERTNIEGPGDFTFNPRNLQCAVIEAGSTELNVFNTQGIWGFDGKDNERRLKMSDIIIENIKGKKNVILAGDFNFNPDTEAILNIEKHLANIFKDELETTFNMKQKTDPDFATAVVDFVFASKNLKVIDHDCPQADVSDHLPLICVFDV